jgi:Glycosyl transferases group 1
LSPAESPIPESKTSIFPFKQILCLCREDNLTNLLAEYAGEIRARGVKLTCVNFGTPYDAAVAQLLKSCSEEPSVIFHPESDFPLLPQGLEQTAIPTVCFQVDTYAFTEHRFRWSSLFDLVAVFHPGYAEKFRKRGHPGAFLLPHAVRKNLYTGAERERPFDVGWVGQTRGVMYRRRESLLPELAKAFRMNEWTRKHTPETLAEAYRSSRIVVNIGRDDYPQDANLRTFEAMAGGALLITSLPSELVELGFAEGAEFVGYREKEEVFELIRRYLNDERARLRIARAGRERVLREHTYECRVETLFQRLLEASGVHNAPARRWTREQVQLTYLDYYASNRALKAAAAMLPGILARGPNHGAAGAILLARSAGRNILAKLRK